MTVQAFHKISRGFLIAILVCCASQTHSQVAYLWLEIDAIWKTRATEYWNNARGYGAKLPVQLINNIDQNSHYTHNNIGIKLQRLLKDANIFDNVELIGNPTNIHPKINDLYIDLVINIENVSEHYPFFKKELTQFLPAATIHATIYSGQGDKLRTFDISKIIDYKGRIKPLLNKRYSDYEKVPEEHKFICIQAFDDAVIELVSNIAKENEIWQQAQGGKDRQPEGTKFNEEMSLLFQERKHKYPKHYSEFSISTTSPNALALNSESRNISEDERSAAYGDEDVAKKLSEALRQIKNYGLFIGINEYADPKMSDLDNPVNDAKILMQALTTHYTFDEENIILLENPTRKDIMRALDHLAATLTNKDNLLIFYAGHGLFDTQLKSGFWLPQDAEHNDRNNWISNSVIRDYIGGIPANHTLLIADACFSGGIFKTREGFSGLTQADIQLYKLSSRKAMTSGTLKTVPDKSVFLQFLAKRLIENDKPFISSEYLFSTFKNAVINNSPNGQIPQFGEIRETGDEGGDFIFIKKKSQANEQ